MLLSTLLGRLLHDPLAAAGGSKAHGELQHGPLLLVLMYSLVHLLSPDHIGTLLTLISVTSPKQAFKVGAAWGLGHSFGMVALSGVFIILHHIVHVDLERWEYYGNYVIGASMLMCSLYFILMESSFLRQKEDGTFVPQPCACHGMLLLEGGKGGSGNPANKQQKRAPQSDLHDSAQPFRDDSYGSQVLTCSQGCHDVAVLTCQPCQDPNAESRMSWKTCPESRPLLSGSSKKPEVSSEGSEYPAWLWRAWTDRDAKGAVLGALQGLCCPVGVVGVGLLAGLPAGSIVVFLGVFIPVSALGTAALATVWASLTGLGCGACVSLEVVYRASCGLTMCIGMAWIIANFSGTLDKLDYTESLHDH